MQNTTLQFEGWGYREIGMAAELLSAYADQKYFGTNKPGYIVSVEMNPGSGNVFMVDEDDNVWMMNGGELDQWVTLPSSGIEDFYSELRSMNDDEIEKLDDEDRAYQQSLTL